jgi:hypothetical protein
LTGLQLFSSNLMAGRFNRLSGGAAGAAERQGSAPVGLSPGSATSAGNGCATLNAGFTLGFMENLFISQLHNPAAPRFVSKKWREADLPVERGNGNLPCENAMTAGDIRPTVA